MFELDIEDIIFILTELMDSGCNKWIILKVSDWFRFEQPTLEILELIKDMIVLMAIEKLLQSLMVTMHESI